MSSVTLMALTGAGVVVLFTALAVYVYRIAKTLEAIGGEPTSYLHKIAFGVRAIEVETGALPPNVEQLNGGLSAARDGLVAIRDRLVNIIDVVGKQGGS